MKFSEIQYCLNNSFQLGLDKGADILSGSFNTGCEERKAWGEK